MSRAVNIVRRNLRKGIRAKTIMLCLFLAFPAWGQDQLAHDDYAWVRKPHFLTALGTHCCSEQHCQPAMAGELRPIPGGWLHAPTQTSIKDDKPGIYPTEDPAGRLFRCVMGGKLVCVMEGLGT
jgi:hypothetical protein